MVFTAATSASTATLQGSLGTALLALLTASTAYTVEFDIEAWVAGGSVRTILGNNTINTYGTITGNGTITTTITTGNLAAVPLRMAGLSGLPYTYTISDIRIYA